MSRSNPPSDSSLRRIASYWQEGLHVRSEGSRRALGHRETFIYYEGDTRPDSAAERHRDELKAFVFGLPGESISDTKVNDDDVFSPPDNDTHVHQPYQLDREYSLKSHGNRSYQIEQEYSPEQESSLKAPMSAPARPTKPSFFTHVCATSTNLVKQYSNSLASTIYEVDSHEPIGKWVCCKCDTGHELYGFSRGPHPLSALNCVCTHRSCVGCGLDGSIKRFEPMNNPEVVQLSEDKQKEVCFGVFCDGCGMSWRAQEVSKERSKESSALHRISAFPKWLFKHGAHRPHDGPKQSKSMMHLPSGGADQSNMPSSKSYFNLRALSNEMAKGFGKQVDGATVKFMGICCTCGTITAETCLCFQIVKGLRRFQSSQPKKTRRKIGLQPKFLHSMVSFPKFGRKATSQSKVHHEAVQPTAERKAPTLPIFTFTEEDLAQGYGTPTITIQGIQHPNPLMSSPVTSEDLL